MAVAVKRFIGFTSLVLCFALAIYFATRPGTPPLTMQEQAAQNAARKFSDALIRCENKTRESLADPAGFDPEPRGQWIMQEASEDRYVLTFRARAKNAFGGLIWGRFECVATYDGDRWVAEVRVL